MRDSQFIRSAKQTFSEWLEDKAPQLAAALAYYAVISLAPLILKEVKI
jgi:membrane protein